VRDPAAAQRIDAIWPRRAVSIVTRRRQKSSGAAATFCGRTVRGLAALSTSSLICPTPDDVHDCILAKPDVAADQPGVQAELLYRNVARASRESSQLSPFGKTLRRGLLPGSAGNDTCKTLSEAGTAPGARGMCGRSRGIAEGVAHLFDSFVIEPAL